MRRIARIVRIFGAIICLFLPLQEICAEGVPPATFPPVNIASLEAHLRALPRLNKMLEERSLQMGNRLFIRIFKQSFELELWLQRDGGKFEHFKTYGICHRSGTIGPKLKRGDKQSPEGFYRITPAQMNPWSKFHLSFNLGYPNEYDRAHNRSGSALMIHGRCSSAGCIAMTDYYMDEIYTLATAALANGQGSFQVHIFPFRMTDVQMELHRSSPWIGFWKNLKVGYDLFEKYLLVPQVTVHNKTYRFTHQYDNTIARITP